MLDAGTIAGATKSPVAMHSGQWKLSPASAGASGTCCTPPACVHMNTGICGARGIAADTSGHSAPKATANAATRAKIGLFTLRIVLKHNTETQGAQRTLS